jgi:SAM-dependent methyltransferase
MSADQPATDTESGFDTEALFDEDYLYFYTPHLSDEVSDTQADLVWRLFGLEPGMEVLDLACGHGRITNRLATRGCRMTGLDATPLFLERARADAADRGVDVEYVHGDMRALAWSGRFDRVLNWFTSFGYFDDDGNRRVLAEVARALRPGGRFLVELMHRDWLMGRFRPANVVERDGDLLVDRPRLDPLTSRVYAERTVVRGGRVRTTTYFVRMFSFTELRDWLLAAGFTSVDGYGPEGERLHPESSRMLVIASR